MFTCPNCRRGLVRHRTELGLLWACDACGGRAVGFEMLRRRVASQYMNALWLDAAGQPAPAGKNCPCCERPMAQVPTEGLGATVTVDLCRRCHFLWLDGGEAELLPFLPPPQPAENQPPLSQKAREAVAMMEVERLREQARGQDWDAESPSEPWQVLAGILGLPIEEDAPALQRLPWATWTLSAVIVAVSVAAFFSNLPACIQAWGLIPAEAMRAHGLTFFTSFFLHGDWLHLLGNVYFLLIFGDNVEDYLGRARYVLLIVSAAFIGDLAHILADPRSDLPIIGASGGISGVIAFYALRFPDVKLTFSVTSRWGLWTRGLHWFRISAAWAMVIWVGLQLIGAAHQLSGTGAVSAFAHLGGGLAGLAAWVAWRE